MIEYIPLDPFRGNTSRIQVKLDGKIVGKIVPVRNGLGWQYFPHKSKSGSAVFDTIAEVKRSLEAQ